MKLLHSAEKDVLNTVCFSSSQVHFQLLIVAYWVYEIEMDTHESGMQSFIASGESDPNKHPALSW